MMRYLAIDFGTKKIGLALSDESGSMAFPHSVIPNNEDLQKTLEGLIKKESVKEIVIGHSINKDGSNNQVHSLVETLITDLTLSCGLPIHLEPEQYSTQHAARIQGQDAMTDAAAAALILDSYLRKKQNKSAFDDLNE